MGQNNTHKRNGWEAVYLNDPMSKRKICERHLLKSRVLSSYFKSDIFNEYYFGAIWTLV